MSMQRFFLVLLIVFSSSDALGKDLFSWEMFLPAISNRCRADSLVYCRTSVACEGRGGYWYEESCHAEPQPVCGVARPDLCTTEPTCSAAGGYWYDESCYAEPPVCGTNHLDLCASQQECLAVGGYWYTLTCHPEQSPDFINTMKLAGDWYFRMNAGNPGAFSRLYSMDGGTVRENPVGSGVFTIEGSDEDRDSVIGGYVRESDDYTMHVSKTDANILYKFDFTFGTDVSGCYYAENKDDGTLGPCIPMGGAKL
ncbi:MAG: hypothetical protein ACYDBT_10350 [Desulfobulbaceae bacterium]